MFGHRLFGLTVLIAHFIILTDSTPVSNSQFAFVEDVRRNSPSRIVAGWPAQDGQIPHQISLRMVDRSGGASSCGGSVIHPQWVLTAAHCIANRFTFVLRFGLTNLTRPDVILESHRKYIHPGYYEPVAGVQTDDIGLVGLDYTLSYSLTLQPVRMMSSAQKNIDFTGVVMTASGYGRTDDPINGGAASEILNWVYLRGISNDECRSWYGGSSIIKEPTICVEYYNDTAQSSCQGDSGGPLTFIDYDGRPTVGGVASFVSSAGCNSPFPSGWVRPGHYHDWYRQVTGLNFDWSPIGMPGSRSEGGDQQHSADPMKPIILY